jgi:hypothetical protein
MSEAANNVVELKPAEPTLTDDEREQRREYRAQHCDFILRHLPRWSGELLKEIQEVAPEAFIAGGLLRDLANQLEIEKLKDVDIFLSVAHWEQVMEVVKQSHPEVECVESSYKWRGDDDRNVAVVHECRSKMGVLPVNLVAMAIRYPLDRSESPEEITPEEITVEKIISDFDFGMCQIAFNGEKIITTEAFWEDQVYSKFTLVRCVGWWDFNRSMERFKRFQAKYSYSLPPELQKIRGRESESRVRLEFAPQFKAYELHRLSLEELREGNRETKAA